MCVGQLKVGVKNGVKPLKVEVGSRHHGGQRRDGVSVGVDQVDSARVLVKDEKHAVSLVVIADDAADRHQEKADCGADLLQKRIQLARMRKTDEL
jgi:hypothetical protein